MAFKIVGNVDANRDLMYLSWNKEKVGHLQEQLSTGLRLVRASDNTNDYFIANKLNEIQTGMNKSVSNMKQALAAVRIAEQAASKIYDLLVKIKETLLEVADTDSKEVRKNAMATIKGYLTQIQALANNSKYTDNEDQVAEAYNSNILEGGTLYVHTGPQANQYLEINKATGKGNELKITVSLGTDSGTSQLQLNATAISIQFKDSTGTAPQAYQVDLFSNDTFSFSTMTKDGVEASLKEVENALNAIGRLQTFLGQSEEILQNLVENQQYKMEQLHEVESQLRDVDYAKAFSEMNKMRVVLQANVAAVAQNNQINQLVTQLMR
jgi:flagellin-like hook-associated protein FlgL